MVSNFLSSGITPKECISEIIIAILGGSDTMSITLHSVFLYTITNPRVYSLLTAEILSEQLPSSTPIPSSRY